MCVCVCVGGEGGGLFHWVMRVSSSFPGEICGFRVHNGPSGSGTVQFEAVVLDRSTGEGLVRSKEPLDCESQREHSFTIQAYDCGEGPDGVNSKKSHKSAPAPAPPPPSAKGRLLSAATTSP